MSCARSAFVIFSLPPPTWAESIGQGFSMIVFGRITTGVVSRNRNAIRSRLTKPSHHPPKAGRRRRLRPGFQSGRDYPAGEKTDHDAKEQGKEPRHSSIMQGKDDRISDRLMKQIEGIGH